MTTTQPVSQWRHRDTEREPFEREATLESLHWRYAVKKFDAERTIPPEDWEVLESALMLSPSGYGLQPWRFIVVRDKATRRRLTPVSLNQAQVEDCSHLVVLCSKVRIDAHYVDSFVSEVARVRGLPRETLCGFYEMIVGDIVTGPKSRFQSEWAARQAYIALGALVMAAARLRIDACPMEGIIPEKYDEILGLSGEGYRTLVACALGYRSEDDKYANVAKVRFSREKIIQTI